MKRLLLAIAGALVNINIWTGAPALALLVGAQIAGWLGGSRAPGTGVSMQGVLSVVVVLAAFELALVALVAKVNGAYEKLIGRPSRARRRTPWLRSLGNEREKYERESYGITAIERIGIFTVVISVLVFEVWFILSPREALMY